MPLVGQPLTATVTGGGVSLTSHYWYNAHNLPSWSYDAAAGEQEVEYNDAKQVTTARYRGVGETDWVTLEQAYVYTGGPVRTVTLKQGASTVATATNTYGDMGEVLDTSGDVEKVTVERDALLRPQALLDGENHRTDLTYDDAGRLTGVTLPGGDTQTFTAFDAVGRVLGDQLGTVTRAYSYNGFGDLTGVQYPATPTMNVALTPDSEGLLTAWYDGTSSGGIDSEDVLGHVLSRHVNYAGLLATLNYAYTYKPDGSPETSSTPVGNFTYGYDGLGRVNSYTTPLGEAHWEYEAAPTGRVQRQLLPNGAYTAYTYTAKGQLQSQTNLWDNGTPDLFTDDILLSAFTIPAANGYDAAGRLLTLQVDIPNHPELSGTKTFQYYPDGKLQQESFVPDQGTGYTHTFTYDNAGNPTILRGTTTNREYNAANQLTGWYHDGQWQRGTAAFTYDDRGNPTTYKGDTLTYDPEGRLTQYGTALTAGYDSDGVRLWKDAGGQRTYFIDGGEMDAAGNVTATDVFGPTGLLARQTIQGQTSTTVFYLFDPLGNVVQRLDATGAVLSVDAYDAWGAQLAGAGDDPYGYKGQVGYYTDSETGLILCTHRYYDPATGRWVNRDPIGYAGGLICMGIAGGIRSMGWIRAD